MRTGNKKAETRVTGQSISEPLFLPSIVTFSKVYLLLLLLLKWFSIENNGASSVFLVLFITIFACRAAIRRFNKENTLAPNKTDRSFLAVVFVGIILAIEVVDLALGALLATDNRAYLHILMDIASISAASATIYGMLGLLVLAGLKYLLVQLCLLFFQDGRPARPRDHWDRHVSAERAIDRQVSLAPYFTEFGFFYAISALFFGLVSWLGKIDISIAFLFSAIEIIVGCSKPAFTFVADHGRPPDMRERRHMVAGSLFISLALSALHVVLQLRLKIFDSSTYELLGRLEGNDLLLYLGVLAVNLLVIVIFQYVVLRVSLTAFLRLAWSQHQVQAAMVGAMARDGR